MVRPSSENALWQFAAEGHAFVPRDELAELVGGLLDQPIELIDDRLVELAFSENGLVIGAGMEDLGKGHRSMVGTMYGTRAKGTRYLEMTEGYVVKMALDKDDQVCGYQFLSMGKMMDDIKKGLSAQEAYDKNLGTYGRFKAEDGAVKWIDPRKE